MCHKVCPCSGSPWGSKLDSVPSTLPLSVFAPPGSGDAPSWRERNPPDKRLSTAAVEAAQIDTGGIDGHGRQRSRLRDTRNREILQEESGDRSCGLINTHCMQRDSKIERAAGGRCLVGSDVHLSWRWLWAAAAHHCFIWGWDRAGPTVQVPMAVFLPVSSHSTGVQCPLRCLGVPPGCWVPKGACLPCVLVTSSSLTGMSLPPVGILEDGGHLCVGSRWGEGQLECKPWSWSRGCAGAR